MISNNTESRIQFNSCLRIECFEVKNSFLFFVQNDLGAFIRLLKGTTTGKSIFQLSLGSLKWNAGTVKMRDGSSDLLLSK